jgi:hypothetical protein
LCTSVSSDEPSWAHIFATWQSIFVNILWWYS